MISNVERVLKKSWEEAEKKGMEKGMERGMEKGMELASIKFARQMLLDNEDMNKIIKYTGLSKEEIENLK